VRDTVEEGFHQRRFAYPWLARNKDNLSLPNPRLV
jgi:hypothetical protein